MPIGSPSQSPWPKSGCSGELGPIAAMYWADRGSTGRLATGVFQTLSGGSTGTGHAGQRAGAGGGKGQDGGQGQGQGQGANGRGPGGDRRGAARAGRASAGTTSGDGWASGSSTRHGRRPAGAGHGREKHDLGRKTGIRKKTPKKGTTSPEEDVMEGPLVLAFGMASRFFAEAVGLVPEPAWPQRGLGDSGTASTRGPWQPGPHPPGGVRPAGPRPPEPPGSSYFSDEAVAGRGRQAVAALGTDPVRAVVASVRAGDRHRGPDAGQRQRR